MKAANDRAGIRLRSTTDMFALGLLSVVSEGPPITWPLPSLTTMPFDWQNLIHRLLHLGLS